MSKSKDKNSRKENKKVVVCLLISIFILLILVAGALFYINNNVDKNASILFLPEGQIFNYLTDRKVNLKCHMMDRLYHDAYGQEEARDKIASTKSDYIFLYEKIKLKDFYRPFLYKKGESLAWDYIDKNYKIVEIIYNGELSNDTYTLKDCIYIAKRREQH